MGSLNASLEAQTQKFESDFANFSNIIKQMSGTYKDMSTAALTNYQNAYTAYKDEVDRLQKIQDDLQAHKDAIEIMNQQYNNNIKLEAYKNTHPSVGDIKTGNEIGYENIGGEWMSKDRNTIISPSGNAYDWSTYNAVGTPAQQAAYIKSVQQSINSIGKLNNEQELSNYISNNMAGSNITAQDVINMSGKMGVGWEEVL
jgi:cation transport regulator ChaB